MSCGTSTGQSMTGNTAQTASLAMPYRRLRCFLRGLSHVLVSMLYRLSYEGLENVPRNGPAILIANHTSLLDMFAIHVRVSPWIHWVSKQELFRVPLLAGLLRRLGCIPVQRDKADMTAARGIMNALKEKQIVGMFPQGTRVRPDQISSVRPRGGAVHFAMRTAVPILPVAINGRFRLFGRVRIVFGKPFQLSRSDLDRSLADPFERLTLDTMQRVFDLIGQADVYGQIRRSGGQDK